MPQDLPDIEAGSLGEGWDKTQIGQVQARPVSGMPCLEPLGVFTQVGWRQILFYAGVKNLLMRWSQILHDVQ